MATNFNIPRWNNLDTVSFDDVDLSTGLSQIQKGISGFESVLQDSLADERKDFSQLKSNLQADAGSRLEQIKQDQIEAAYQRSLDPNVTDPLAGVNYGELGQNIIAGADPDLIDVGKLRSTQAGLESSVAAGLATRQDQFNKQFDFQDTAISREEDPLIQQLVGELYSSTSRADAIKKRNEIQKKFDRGGYTYQNTQGQQTQLRSMGKVNKAFNQLYGTAQTREHADNNQRIKNAIEQHRYIKENDTIIAAEYARQLNTDILPGRAAAKVLQDVEQGKLDFNSGRKNIEEQMKLNQEELNRLEFVQEQAHADGAVLDNKSLNKIKQLTDTKVDFQTALDSMQRFQDAVAIEQLAEDTKKQMDDAIALAAAAPKGSPAYSRAIEDQKTQEIMLRSIDRQREALEDQEKTATGNSKGLQNFKLAGLFEQEKTAKSRGGDATLAKELLEKDVIRLTEKLKKEIPDIGSRLTGADMRKALENEAERFAKRSEYEELDALERAGEFSREPDGTYNKRVMAALSERYGISPAAISNYMSLKEGVSGGAALTAFNTKIRDLKIEQDIKLRGKLKDPTAKQQFLETHFDDWDLFQQDAVPEAQMFMNALLTSTDLSVEDIYDVIIAGQEKGGIIWKTKDFDLEKAQDYALKVTGFKNSAMGKAIVGERAFNVSASGDAP